MVANEFFKSIARTLGRIFAYILLGILAYFIFTWFNADAVKAETIVPNSLTMYGINTSDQSYSYSVNNSNNIYNASPDLYKINGIEAYYNNKISMQNKGTYIFTILIDFYAPYSTGTGIQSPTIVMQTGTGSSYSTTMTFDNVIAQNSGYVTSSGSYQYHYQYQVKGEVESNGTFTNLYINAYFPRLNTQYYVIEVEFQEKGVDTSGLIIENNNYNTDRIIGTLNNWANNLFSNQSKNTQDLIDSGVFNTAQVTDKLENMYDATVELEDTMTDESAASNILVQGVQNILPSGPATELLQLPFTMVNSLYNGLNGTCSPWTIDTGPLLGNHTWTIPCINLARRLGSDVWTYQGFSLWQLIDMMGFIFMVYEIIMLMINGYNMIAELRDPWEVLYVPKHGGFDTRSGRNYVEY